MKGVQPMQHGKTSGSNMPLVSIITSTLNAVGYLPDAIRSIRDQKYENFEWIIIDAGSTDGTLELIQQHEDIIDYWVSEPDKGIYDAWNKGLRVARGEWVCFLGADDLLMPDAISNMVMFESVSLNRLDFISGRVAMYDGDVLLRTIGRPWEWSKFKRYMCVAHTGALHRMSYFKRHGEFDASFRISGDYEMLLRGGPELKTGFVNCVVASMQIGGQSNGNAIVFRDAMRARLMHNLTTPAWGYAHAKWSQIKWYIRRLTIGV
jgi:glycosyltransferase involved in cell wall biosynthesis